MRFLRAERMLSSIDRMGLGERPKKFKDAGLNGHLVKSVDFAALDKFLAGFASVPWTVS